MSREIMVPLDGTHFAEAALPAAIRMARREHAGMRLVGVWQSGPPVEEHSSWELEREELRAQDRDALDRYLHETAERVAGTSQVSVNVDLLEGDVDEALPKWAAQADIEMAVMATHARKPVIRAWLGSAADHMVREGGHPVLLVHPEEDEPRQVSAPAPPFRKVVVALDGSELSEISLNRTLLAGEDGDLEEIVLLRVLPFASRTVSTFRAEHDGLTEDVHRSVEEAEAYLKATAERLVAWAGRVSTKVLVDPDIAQAIVGFAGREGADLVAVATHGRGGVNRAIRGSVADQVMRNAKVPVLVVPAA